MGERLLGEVAIVTGSTSGLGREIARLFASEGCMVTVTGRHADRGRATVEAIQSAGGHAAFVPADLTNEEQCQSLVTDAASRWGNVTVLVNNAVASSPGHGDGKVTEVSPASFEEVLRVNLVSAATMCSLVILQMLEAGHGSIVNISSRAAERGTPGLAAYTASKGGLNALALSITADYASRGVRCNTVQPGYILHERRDAALTADQRSVRQAMQLTRLATATDVAYAALFLASRESEVISGITLPVDGGSTAVRGRTLG